MSKAVCHCQSRELRLPSRLPCGLSNWSYGSRGYRLHFSLIYTLSLPVFLTIIDQGLETSHIAFIRLTCAHYIPIVLTIFLKIFTIPKARYTPA